MPSLKSPPKESKLASVLSGVEMPKAGPVWAGPCGEGPQGGVTQSLICRYLSCKERFRVLTVEGWQPAPAFQPTLEFGNLWHACEEDHAADRDWNADGSTLWEYVAGLRRRFPLQQEQILHWCSIAAELFPRYVDHWAKHPDVRKRTPLLQEEPFNVAYRLPSGRVVRLRGKWDSADLIEEKPKGIYLQENKTKGTIDGTKIRRQLTFDLQTMLYLVALIESKEQDKTWKTEGPVWKNQILGVRYNAIRRSAHKSVESMLKKLEDDRSAGRIEEWFARWRVEVSAVDVARFKRECLDPVLENLCDDWEWWAWCVENSQDHFDSEKRFAMDGFGPGGRHFRMPYVGYNPLAEGGFGDVDAYLETGSTAGLQRVKDLFPELVA